MPSEVTRYLLNQLEQVHIKLKTLGYCKSDIRSGNTGNLLLQQQQQDGGGGGCLNSQQQAFITIDNFSSEVLALHTKLSAKPL